MRRPPSPTISGSGKGGDDNNTGSVKKGPWTPEEDKRLVDYIQKHGHGSWRAVPKLAGLNRCGKSCRLRWTNYLRPDIKRGKFTEEEEQLIIKLHSVIGNKWSAIATRLPGRTDNEIKNHWNTHLRKRLLQMGIDPTTHRPITDFNFVNALANLPHLLALAASFGSNNVPTNPIWDSINTLRLCSDAAQITKELQLLQNSTGSQTRMPGPTTQFGYSNQLLDHLALINPSIPEFQIPRPGIILNETNQGKTDTLMNMSSSTSSLNTPGCMDIPGNPMFPMPISASLLPEHPPSSSIDWTTDKERSAVLGSFDNISTATMFEAWRDIKMDDDKGIDSYSTYWQDILYEAMSP